PGQRAVRGAGPAHESPTGLGTPGRLRVAGVVDQLLRYLVRARAQRLGHPDPGPSLAREAGWWLDRQPGVGPGAVPALAAILPVPGGQQSGRLDPTGHADRARAYAWRLRQRLRTAAPTGRPGPARGGANARSRR